MTSYWDELCQAEELAYFKGDMVLDSPESYTAEEMWDVVMEMFEATIAVQDAMHEDFMSHIPEERQALLDACVGSGTASEEWWKNTLLGYEEMPDYPAQITGGMAAQ
ncbi:MAG: hypothetical protein IKG21_06035 [Atopobiaceae bacterium]|nr:hypothetical protein [Atopobiaceae bacterium]